MILAAVFLIGFGCGSGVRQLPVELERIRSPLRRLELPSRSVTLRSPAQYLRVVAGGDVMIGHWTLQWLESKGADYPFRRIRPLLQTGDVVFANLEAPFADTGQAVEKTFTFRVPTRFAAGLASAGFNVVSVANNHILDFGAAGLQSTLEALAQNGIAFAGAGDSLEAAWHPAILETPAGRVGLLAFSMTFPREFWATDSTGGTAYPEEPRLIAALDSLQQVVDFVIVSFHWGAEKRESPKDYQVYFAHLAIDHGADLVLGHHPHVLQGFELYRNRLIAYSLGNLAFSSYSRAARSSAVVKAVLHKSGLLFARILPLNIDNVEVEFQPAPAGDSLRAAVIARLDSLSRPLNRGRDILNDDGFIWGAMFPEDSTRVRWVVDE